MTLEQLTNEFEFGRSHLKSYLVRITASAEDAEDIVQDTFIVASQKLHTFRGDSSVKTWIFTIASNLAKDDLRAKKRWTENVTDICKAKALADPTYIPDMMTIQATSPHGQFEVREHITFCLTCISKSLPLEQQICILLKEVYDFKVSEIAWILNTTEAMVKYYLYTSRAKMIHILDGRCALINKEGTCHQCSELNGTFQPWLSTGYSMLDTFTSCLYLFALLVVFENYEIYKERQLEGQREQAVLRLTEERWRLALEGSGDAIWDWDLGTDGLRYSRRFAEMLGYGEGELGTTVGTVWAHPSR